MKSGRGGKGEGGRGRKGKGRIKEWKGETRWETRAEDEGRKMKQLEEGGGEGGNKGKQVRDFKAEKERRGWREDEWLPSHLLLLSRAEL